MPGFCPENAPKAKRQLNRLQELAEVTQTVFTCSKLIIETLDRGMKYV